MSQLPFTVDLATGEILNFPVPKNETTHGRKEIYHDWKVKDRIARKAQP